MDRPPTGNRPSPEPDLALVRRVCDWVLEMEAALGRQATERLLSQIYVSTVFMGCDAVDVDNGIVLSHLRHLDYIGRIIGNARQTILLVDSDKFSTVHGIRITDLAAISLIITDGGLPEEMREKLLRRGVGLEIAERSPG